MLDMTDAAASTDLSEGAKQVMAVLNETIDSVCHTQASNFWDREKLQKESTREELAESVDFLLCHSPYILRCQSELKNIEIDKSEPSDMAGL